MSVETAADLQNLINSGDLNTAAELPDGTIIQGVFLSSFQTSYSINGYDTTYRCSNADAALVSVDSAITINGITYTVREKETGDRMTLFNLEN